MNQKTNVRLVLTDDGSHSVYNEDIGQHYHSIFGAHQESQRVFIELGLAYAFTQFKEDLHVFEMGFGTGLNALLTANEALKHQRRVVYTTVESLPLPLEAAHRLNFDELLGTYWLKALHDTPWEQRTPVNEWLTLSKHRSQIQDFQTDARFHLVYYDAFAPEGQPELWTEEIFQKMASMMLPGGVLTTYCSKSAVQRNLKSAGFTVEKHIGPARKREVLRAILQ